jgi:putative transposase
MKNPYQRLLLLIAGATQQGLDRQVRYLKVENEILRSKLPTRVSVTGRGRSTPTSTTAPTHHSSPGRERLPF